MLLPFFEWLGGLIGLPEDQARMVFGFIITIPLGFLFKKLKSNSIQSLILRRCIKKVLWFNSWFVIIIHALLG